MNKCLKLFIALAIICCFATTSYGKSLVTEFKGSTSKYTGEFEARAPWILDWRVTGDQALTPTLSVTLHEAGTNVFVGSVLRTKMAGNGVRLFRESGRYQFQVTSSMAHWTLRVEELTREEAEEYTPIGVD